MVEYLSRLRCRHHSPTTILAGYAPTATASQRLPQTGKSRRAPNTDTTRPPGTATADESDWYAALQSGCTRGSGQGRVCEPVEKWNRSYRLSSTGEASLSTFLAFLECKFNHYFCYA